MSIDLEDARRQAAALRAAHEGSPVRQYRYPLGRSAREWERAAGELEADIENEAVIELAMSVVPGMRVATEYGWSLVLRAWAANGQFSLHVETNDPRGLYVNLVGPSSPVVVKA